MEDIVQIGDYVICKGKSRRVTQIGHMRSMYQLDNSEWHFRFEFTPEKWLSDALGHTGIGVCASGAAGQ